MNPWTDLLLLTLVVVWIVDVSGWTAAQSAWQAGVACHLSNVIREAKVKKEIKNKHKK